MSSILNEFTESIFQIDRVIFFTLRQLFTNPGKSIREYLNGKRKKYVKPIAYLVTFSTIYYIISKIVGQNTWMDDFIKGLEDWC